jgi:putative salt-induced outer membrane protein YdiY
MKKLLLLFLFSGFIGTTYADEIVLENGDTLTGTVTKIEGGKLTLETKYSEPININASKIKSITTDKPSEIYLITGEKLEGTLKTIDEGRVAVDEGTVIDWAQIKTMNEPPRKWTGSITVGANRQKGNTDETSVSVGARATRRTEKDRFNIRFLYNYSEESGNLTERNAYGRIKYDYFFTKRFYTYFGVETEYDKFKDLDLRAIVGPGLGYQVLEDSTKSLALEGGLTYHIEQYGEDEDDEWYESRFAIQFNYKIFKNLFFSNDFVNYRRIDHISNYRLRNEAELKTNLGTHFALKVINIYEYDSDSAEDTRKEDQQWILGIEYSF